MASIQVLYRRGITHTNIIKRTQAWNFFIGKSHWMLFTGKKQLIFVPATKIKWIGMLKNG